MSLIVIKNGEVLTETGIYSTSVWINDGIINSVADSPEDSLISKVDQFEIIDAKGFLVSPGLVDLQVNGSEACNLWDYPGEQSLNQLRSQMLDHGVTTFLPTLITDSIETLIDVQSELTEYGVGSPSCFSNQVENSRMAGFHLEGPFLSRLRPGVHPKECIISPRVDLLEQLVSNQVKLMTMAVEEDKSGQCLDWLIKRGVAVSIGHSDASYEDAMTAFSNGVEMVTHIFNAMPAFHHRDPGLVGAALLNRNVSCCLIADGLHLDPATVDLIFRQKGVDKTILVTDIAHIGTNDGGLVGSSITLDMAVRNLCEWQICTLSEAISMASINPARAISIDEKVGSLKAGKLADICLWNQKTNTIEEVFLGGKRSKASQG